MEDSAEDRVRCYKHSTAECESEKGEWLRGPEFRVGTATDKLTISGGTDTGSAEIAVADTRSVPISAQK